MEKFKGDANDKDIRKIEHLLEDVSKYTDEFTTEKNEGPIQEQISKSVRKDLGMTDDGNIEIRVSVDGMGAFADFYPPVGNGNPITLEDAISLLKQKKIKYGIIWDTIKKTIAFCNTNKKQTNNVLIAQGKIPVDEIPAHYVIEASLLKEDEIITPEDNEVDFKEKSPFRLVKKGQILAKKIPSTPGELGFNVFGSSLSYKTKQKPKIMAGKNVRSENDAYISISEGRFQNKGSLFWVDEVLFIDTDVDYKTGHIDFPGDILIRGLVKDGFKITAGKSIICQSTLDASEVYCKGDLLVHNGIIGKRNGIVKVEGKIKTKFIENCNVEAKEMIEVKKSIINSNVYTLDKITLGDRGVIIGGVIFAQTGIEARQIGGESAPRTEIYCGVDFIVQKKLEWVKSKRLELAAKIDEIQNRINRSQEEDSKLLALSKDMKNAMDKLTESAKILLFHLDKNEDAKIIVRGIIYPGTIIEICHIRYIVPDVLPRVVFTLNRRKGKIEIKTL